MVLPDGGKTCETHGERKRAVCIGYTSSSLSNEIEELCLHRCGQFNCLGISVSVLFFLVKHGVVMESGSFLDISTLTLEA